MEAYAKFLKNQQTFQLFRKPDKNLERKVLNYQYNQKLPTFLEEKHRDFDCAKYQFQIVFPKFKDCFTVFS